MLNLLYKTFQNNENKKNYKNHNFINSFSKTNSNIYNHFSIKNTLSNENFRKYVMNSHLNNLKLNVRIQDYNKIVNSINNTLSNDKIKVDINFIFFTIFTSFGYYIYCKYNRNL